MKCVRRAVALGILILAFEHHPAIAACDPTSADASAIAAARAEIASSCNCASAPNHGNYVTCAGGILRTRVQRNQLSNDCRGALESEAARSTCGISGEIGGGHAD